MYKSQVHEARGSEQYNELMKCWNPLVKRALLDFTYEVERAFSPEPGVLLVRWRAEWRGSRRLFYTDWDHFFYFFIFFAYACVRILRRLKRESGAVNLRW